MFSRFGVLAVAIAVASGCDTTAGSASSDAAVARGTSIASSVPDAYGTIPCSLWSMAGEKSMLGYQRGREPLDVLFDMPRALRSAENVDTLRHVMSNVTMFDVVDGEDAKISLGGRYADLVDDECRAVRTR